MGVDHGGGDVCVTEELLDDVKIYACMVEVGGVGMTEGVWGGLFEDGALLECSFEVFLGGSFVGMVASA